MALSATPRLSPIARHVISRLTFGQTPELTREVANNGLDEFMRRQFNPQAINDSVCDNALARFTRLRLSSRELVASNSQWQLQSQLVGASIVRATLSQRQLLEVMVDFWTNHLSVNAAKSRVAYHLPTDNNTFRRLALSSYRSLLLASTKSLSMLTFLDNRTSRANGERPPNENYARELLEIHTLGDPAAFSEDDVKAVAHVFSGWTIDTTEWRFTFRSEWNNLGPAASRETLGWRPVAGSGSMANGESLLAHLARHPLTARNLAHKLCRHFIRDDLGATDAIVQRVAKAYLDTGTDIRATLGTLFGSAEFRDSIGTRVKRPNELLCSMLRASGARFRLDDNVQGSSRALKEELVRLDQATFESPSPKGYPLDDAAWVDASALINRWNLAFRVASNRVAGADIDTYNIADGARNAGEFVDLISLRLLGTTLPGNERRHMLAHLNASDSSPVDYAIRLKRAAIIGLVLASPTFQAR